MTQRSVRQTQVFSQKETEQVQQILVSIIPATAILLIGVYGSQMVPARNVLLFCVIFLLGALLTFLGEKKVISLMHHARESRYLELTTACRKFLVGDLGVKVVVRGHDELTTLAETINLLLDQQRRLLQRSQSSPPSPEPASPSFQATFSAPAPQSSEAELLKEQLMQIINDLAPITKGDLRVQMAIPGNLVGIIAGACNSFIEELSQFVKWTRYASQVVTTASRSILDRSIEMAKSTENQMQRLSTTTNNIEEIASFMQHLSNKLHLNIDISKEVQSDIRTKIQPIDLTGNAPAGQLLNELQRQTELLEGILHEAEETSTITESLIGDLYTVAQQIYQSSVIALKTVKRLSELEALAERWYNVAAAFTVYEDEEANAVNEPWLL